MKIRKKKIILIQLTIFLIASLLVYNTYRDKTIVVEQAIEIEAQSDIDTNSFTGVEYSGFDLNGNRYILKAKKADFKTESPELIDMSGVVSTFYLSDDTILTVISDEGLYNNITFDMEFRKNVISTYLTHTLLSDKLNYSNTNGNLIASGNVKGESVEKGEFFADKVEYTLASKVLDFSMFGNDQVNLKLKR
jgi:hypothetical protein|tara:strand:+ start:1523 stop:2098 length:576 start_codon:yes stop_codon:yes gene_type:complete